MPVPKAEPVGLPPVLYTVIVPLYSWASTGAKVTVTIFEPFAGTMMGGELLRPETMAEVRTRHSPTRGLGWEIAYPGWSGGDACSADTIGHTGFTGTGLWMDFASGRAWTLLTNRVHPTRFSDSGIIPLRRMVGDILGAE